MFCSTSVQKNEWEINLRLRFNLCLWLSVSIMLIKLLCYQFTSLLTSIISATLVSALSGKALLLWGVFSCVIVTRVVLHWDLEQDNSPVTGNFCVMSWMPGLCPAQSPEPGCEQSWLQLCLIPCVLVYGLYGLVYRQVSLSGQSLNDTAWCLFIFFPHIWAVN